MSYTESSLKALTVVKLKEILSTHSLPVTGKKDDLISRILESNLGEESTESTMDPTGQSTDEPDGAGVGATTQELAPAATLTPQDGEEPSVTTAAQDQEEDKEKVEQVSEEEKLRLEEEKKLEREQAGKMEEEKRKQRLARFGGGESANSEVDQKDEEKKKRAERFGLNVSDENDSTKLNKSLDALDKPLGSNRRERKPKADKPTPTSKSAPSGEKTIAEKTGNPQAAAEPAAALAAAEKKKELDPEQQKRLQEDEEKKKKRAARFGAPTESEPQEKKAKTD